MAISTIGPGYSVSEAGTIVLGDKCAAQSSPCAFLAVGQGSRITSGADFRATDMRKCGLFADSGSMVDLGPRFECSGDESHGACAVGEGTVVWLGPGCCFGTGAKNLSVEKAAILKVFDSEAEHSQARAEFAADEARRAQEAAVAAEEAAAAAAEEKARKEAKEDRLLAKAAERASKQESVQKAAAVMVQAAIDVLPGTLWKHAARAMKAAAAEREQQQAVAGAATAITEDQVRGAQLLKHLALHFPRHFPSVGTAAYLLAHRRCLPKNLPAQFQSSHKVCQGSQQACMPSHAHTCTGVRCCCRRGRRRVTAS